MMPKTKKNKLNPVLIYNITWRVCSQIKDVLAQTLVLLSYKTIGSWFYLWMYRDMDAFRSLLSTQKAEDLRVFHAWQPPACIYNSKDARSLLLKKALVREK